MSGGSYDYMCFKVQDLAGQIRVQGECSCASPTLRKAFKEHLKKVADALHAIEWNDSCDGASNEAELIRLCLRRDAEIQQAITDAEAAKQALEDAMTIAVEMYGGKRIAKKKA